MEEGLDFLCYLKVLLECWICRCLELLPAGCLVFFHHSGLQLWHTQGNNTHFNFTVFSDVPLTNVPLLPFLPPKQGLFLINNRISKVHPNAFKNMDHLRLLYLSYNLLTEIPANLPPNVIELRFYENNINRIQKNAFDGLRKLHVLGQTEFCLGLLGTEFFKK